MQMSSSIELWLMQSFPSLQIMQVMILKLMNKKHAYVHWNRDPMINEFLIHEIFHSKQGSHHSYHFSLIAMNVSQVKCQNILRDTTTLYLRLYAHSMA